MPNRFNDSSVPGALDKGAIEIARGVREGSLNPIEVISEVRRRISSLDPHIAAFCVVDTEGAYAAAEALSVRRRRGELLGPLAGVPVAVKDTVMVRGLPAVQGSPIYRDFVPEEDDIVVERLRAAGAIIVGKTNVPELAYAGVGHNPVFPTTRNPWNLDRTSGGSSAGSAAAVAAGMVPLAVGSDGGGSIRIPAALCGLFGMKPSFGRVPLYPGCRDERFPGISSWETIEHIGPITRSVADGALMLSVMAGPDDRDRHSIPDEGLNWQDAARTRTLAGKKIAYSENWGFLPVDDDVRRLFRSAVAQLADRLGCHVEEASPGFRDMQNAFWGLVALDTDLRGFRRVCAEHRDEMSPHLVAFLERDWTAEDLTDAVRARKEIANCMWRFMRRFDLLVTPTSLVPAFGLGIRGPEEINGVPVPPIKWTGMTFPFNMTGQPAATVPIGCTPEGLPVGLQIVGRHLADLEVVAAAASIEGVMEFSSALPPPVKKILESEQRS
ncbi:amidase [Futiania mangrovi]|uniref:Amidase family protein n=1 Tax=Futiania mangrovi TaxID=2959716 RepID=A0A9J6PKP8_9PROT|nr:amidase family protein [Futiania mangrovii]MCP1337159.1 amidase family protein [Futiania mangrovii]